MTFIFVINLEVEQLFKTIYHDNRKEQNFLLYGKKSCEESKNVFFTNFWFGFFVWWHVNLQRLFDKEQ